MEPLQDSLLSFRAVGWIQEHQVTRFGQGLSDPRKPLREPGAKDNRSAFQFTLPEILPDRMYALVFLVTEDGTLGATTQCLDPQGTAARKGIQYNATLHRVPEDRKQSLSYPVLRRPHTLPRRNPQPAAPDEPAYHTQSSMTAWRLLL